MTLDKYAGDVRISSEAPTVLAYHSVNAYDVRPQQPIAHVVLYGSRCASDLVTLICVHCHSARANFTINVQRHTLQAVVSM
jgi:hypothetical protein